MKISESLQEKQLLNSNRIFQRVRKVHSQNQIMQGKKKLNRKEFLFEDGWFQTKVKKPKQLVMQQFQISDCEQCNIFLFDSNACVYVDSCKYCNVFIGPSQSSIFIRDCQSINVVSISQQFRVRDSFNCNFAIFCESQPIIESSSEIVFSCYPGQFTYQSLPSQMKEAKLNEWNNNWFDIYDFTPSKFNKTNHRLSSYEKEFVAFKKLFCQKLRQNSIQTRPLPFIPVIQGKLKIESGNSYVLDQIIFLVINPSIQAKQTCSLVLQSKFVPLNAQLQEKLKLKVPKSDKILFLKIKKEDQSRWRQCEQVKKILRNQKQKQLVQNIVFAPFKDEH